MVYLPLKEPLAATFSEICSIFSRKFVAEQGGNAQILRRAKLLWPNFFALALE